MNNGCRASERAGGRPACCDQEGRAPRRATVSDYDAMKTWLLTVLTFLGCLSLSHFSAQSPKPAVLGNKADSGFEVSGAKKRSTAALESGGPAKARGALTTVRAKEMSTRRLYGRT